MPTYLVETYLARRDAGERAAGGRRARSAAEGPARDRVRVGFDCWIYVPEDEICFYVLEAPSSGEAARAAHRAGLDAVRVVEAVSSREEER